MKKPPTACKNRPGNKRNGMPVKGFRNAPLFDWKIKKGTFLWKYGETPANKGDHIVRWLTAEPKGDGESGE